MFKYLKSIFTSTSDEWCCVEGYWCESNLRLHDKVETPLGSRVTIVNVCVDVYFNLEGEDVSIGKVQMSRVGGTISGSTKAINVASTRTGEAWFSSYMCSERQLIEIVKRDLDAKNSNLRKIMFRVKRNSNPDLYTSEAIEALNASEPVEVIEKLIPQVSGGLDVSFIYTKSDGTSNSREVTIFGTSGNSVRGRDHRDGKSKLFRIDRMKHVQKR